jgi:hypothetical protein
MLRLLGLCRITREMTNHLLQHYLLFPMILCLLLPLFLLILKVMVMVMVGVGRRW